MQMPTRNNFDIPAYYSVYAHAKVNLKSKGYFFFTLYTAIISVLQKGMECPYYSVHQCVCQSTLMHQPFQQFVLTFQKTELQQTDRDSDSSESFQHNTPYSVSITASTY